MDDEEWPLTSRAIADSERAAGPGEDDLADDEDPKFGFSMLHELAERGIVREVQPGRFYVSKFDES